MEIVSLFETGRVNTKIHIASNKLKPVDREQLKLKNTLDRYRFVESIFYDQEDLVNKLLEGKVEKIDGNLYFIEKQHFKRQMDH